MTKKISCATPGCKNLVEDHGTRHRPICSACARKLMGTVGNRVDYWMGGKK